MSDIFSCVVCDMSTCATCNGGERYCPDCPTGPMCETCAEEHECEPDTDGGAPPQEPTP